MAEEEVDISGQTSKRFDELGDIELDLVVTVCGHASEHCPRFPAPTRVIHAGFDDPPRLAEGACSEDEALGHYRRVRDEIRRFVETLGSEKRTLQEHYTEVRRTTEALSEPLAVEDQVVQSMPDVSPTKWHLAHVTWFFETFVLKVFAGDYRPFRAEFEYLFNSYYNAVGAQHPRPERGILSRPTVAEVRDYRRHVDAAMVRLLDSGAGEIPQQAAVIEVGLNHEQQHQELLLMDIKHVFSRNPLYPLYRPSAKGGSAESPPLAWQAYEAGRVRIGHEGEGFAYDNEGPAHDVHLSRFELADRLITNGEYLEFMADGAYRRPELWLADGWATVQREGWSAPLYWVSRDDDWFEFSLSGLAPVERSAPVAHVSLYEAAAYAEWAGARLPEEAEWESASRGLPVAGNFLENGRLHPVAGKTGSKPPRQMFGDLWEWTRSAYAPYPGFRAAEGAIGEYNGKFMCNQYVLRGGSCVTPGSHARRTYRNFFYPHCRWQFGGIRLARD
jgi:ergothioneine biosynthesis protein EgtB